MADPLAEIVTLLQPRTPGAKLVTTRGPWRVTRAEHGRPFYCVILEGQSRLESNRQKPILLEKGDFVLIPAAFDFMASSLEVPKKDTRPVRLPTGELRHGPLGGAPETRMLIGYCTFDSPDAALLVSLMPQLVHVRGQARLATLVELVSEETRSQRPARDVVLARLLELILIEALRSTEGTAATPSLLRGLSDPQLALAIRRIHEHPTQVWTVAQLAKEAGLSRSTFFERFHRAVGVPPMEYLLGWRIALAKDLLRREPLTVAEVAQRVGYSSASTFSVAFTRSVGQPPTLYARQYSPRSARLVPAG